MASQRPLPQVVNEIGERIGLDYNVDRKRATKNYIEENRDSFRLEFDQVKHSIYSLDEARTKKQTIKEKKPKSSIKKKKNPLKLNCKIRKQLYKLTPEDKMKLEYSTFEKINELWKQYSSQLMKEFGNGKDEMALFRMDLHGAHLKCTASRNPSLIGFEGIVVQETKNTFLIIKKTNGLVTLPKKECLFEMTIDSKVHVIHGCNHLFTAQSRTKVKNKQRRLLSEV